MPYEASRTYQCDAATPAQARSWSLDCIRSVVAGAGIEALLDDVALVVSELMTNALRAGCGSSRILLHVEGRRLRISVIDDAPGIPMVIDAPPDQPHGRGLQIVAAVASDWGVHSLDGSKAVWADLLLDRKIA